MIRKSIHDDVETLHALVAHWPVEGTAATVTPLALFAYIVVLDWRLALLSIATLPLYFGIQMFSMAGMSEKTALMDTKISNVSSTMVEFASGMTSSNSTTIGAGRSFVGVRLPRHSSPPPCLPRSISPSACCWYRPAM